MNTIQILGLILIVLLGGSLSMVFNKFKYTQWLKITLSFGGAYLLGLAFVELLPIVYAGSVLRIGFWILAGFLLQLVLEQLSKGVEHGHVHSHRHSTRYFIGVMLGLCIHALLEGFPLQENGFIHNHHEHSSYYWGIIIHKLPAAFALGAVALTSGIKNSIAVISLLLFSVMTPVGSWLASSYVFDESIQQIILAVVIGLFLHIATTILFEVEQSSSHHSISWQKLLAILAGFVTVWLI